MMNKIRAKNPPLIYLFLVSYLLLGLPLYFNADGVIIFCLVAETDELTRRIEICFR